MEDVDFDLAFQLYDRQPAVLSTTNQAVHSRAPTASTSAPLKPTSPFLQSPATRTPSSSLRNVFQPSTSTNRPDILNSNSTAPGQSSSSTSAWSSHNSIIASTPSNNEGPKHVPQPTLKFPQAALRNVAPIQSKPGPIAIASPKRTSLFDFPDNFDEFTGIVHEQDVIVPLTKELPAKASTSRAPLGKPKATSSTSSRTSNSENDTSITLESMEDMVPIWLDEACALALPPSCDESQALSWHYPCNYEKREYQYNMVQSALFKNTLVCLPTGLGKTLIAAVVMYNFYRWFPDSKIIFMAPTKPLVAQQIQACSDIVSIPADDTVTMTGKTPADKRSKLWTSKRVFFVTPQVPQNDIREGICPTEKVCLLVFDEAHKAQGDYAYCEVIRAIARSTPYFRVLALSATPGSTSKAIQDVVTNLLISKIELRTEDSPDVKPYVHTRSLEEVSVKIDGPLIKAKELLRAIINVPISWLQSNGALYRLRQGQQWSFTRLEQARTDWRKDPNMQQKADFFKMKCEGNFAAAMSFFHGLHLISDYGLAQFKEWINDQQLKPIREKVSKSFEEMIKSKEFWALRRFINEEIGDASQVKHPKMLKLESIILDHFNSIIKEDQSGEITTSSVATVASDSRVMIFAQFRDTVEDIVTMLENHSPLIKAMPFVGQAKGGLTQKQQTEVVQKFREGHYNTLVSTSIGEEGLDIGEVDLIVCYDSPQSPIRMVQRMGRTGRKRDGRCIMLLTAGTEDVSFKKAKVKSKDMIKAISSKSRFHFFNGAQSTQMLPAHIRSEPMMIFMEKTAATTTTANEETSAPKKPKKSGGRKKKNMETITTSYEDQPEEPQPTITAEEADSKDEHHDEDFTTVISSDSDEDLPNTRDFVNTDDEANVAIDIDTPYNIQDQEDQADTRPTSVRSVSPPNQPFTVQSSSPTLLSSRITTNPVISTPPRQPDQTSSTLLFTSHVVPPSLSRTPNNQKIPTPFMLEPTQSSVDSGRSVHLTLGGFPEGFFDMPNSMHPEPPPHLSSIPPPPNRLISLDYTLGFQQNPEGGLHQHIPTFPSLQLASVAPTSSVFNTTHVTTTLTTHLSPTPLESRFTSLSESFDLDASIVNVYASSSRPSSNAMTFHANESHIKPVTRTPITPEKLPLNSSTASPASKPARSMPPATTTLSSPGLSLLSPIDTPVPSPQFKRLKKRTHAELSDGEEMSSAPGSPPPKKKSMRSTETNIGTFKQQLKPTNTKKRRNRFVDEEASQDDDNSDGEGGFYSSDDDDHDEIANTQDRHFVVSDNDSVDCSTTKMRTVYAKSLAYENMSDSSSYAAQGGRWIDGTDLEEKMKTWADYSDYECTSPMNSSHHTITNDSSIIDLDAEPEPIVTESRKTLINKPIDDSIISVDSNPSPALVPRSHVSTLLSAPNSSIQPKPLTKTKPAFSLGLKAATKPTTTTPTFRAVNAPVLTTNQTKPPSPAQPQSATSTSTANDLLDGLTDEDFLMF